MTEPGSCLGDVGRRSTGRYGVVRGPVARAGMQEGAAPRGILGMGKE